jgi:hypothetical protein
MWQCYENFHFKSIGLRGFPLSDGLVDFAQSAEESGASFLYVN